MKRLLALLTVAWLTAASSASAQNWSFDAREIGLGGIGGSGNLAAKMIDDEREYRSIVLPFGLFQVLRDMSVFDPTSDLFDPIRSVEYAASPLHYVVGRGTTNSGSAFVTDIRNGRLSRDLTAYRGFQPVSSIVSEGLASPNWGGTIKFGRKSDGTFHGVYIGAGPYLSMRNFSNIDPALIDLLAPDSTAVARNAQFPLSNVAQAQMALAITGGYRGRFAWPSGVGSGSPRDGVYVAANYNYLRGFEFEDVDMQARLATDAVGLVTINPGVAPVTVGRRFSTTGRGRAVDIGVGAVIDRWEVGFGANGLGNRITWTDVERTAFRLDSLFGGGSFIESPTIPDVDTRVELPVDYRGSIARRADDWSAAAELGRGYGGTSFHGGLEKRTGSVQLRGGARYTTERWNPTGGIGFDLSRRVSIDVAAYGTSANIERKRQLALAASIRLNRLEAIVP
jgi:hypothetical protein